MRENPPSAIAWADPAGHVALFGADPATDDPLETACKMAAALYASGAAAWVVVYDARGNVRRELGPVPPALPH